MTQHRAIRTPLLLSTIMIGSILLPPSPIFAAETEAEVLKDAAKRCAERIEAILGTIPPDQRQVWIRAFECPGGCHVGIANAIGEELGKDNKFKVGKGHKIEVAGSFKRLPADESKPLRGVTINGRVKVPNQEKPEEFEVVVNKPKFGAGITMPTTETKKPPGEVKKRPPKTEPTVVGTEIRPAPESPYGIEILVESPNGTIEVPSDDGTRTYKYVARDIIVENMIPRVKLNKDEKYAIRIHNRTRYEACVGVQIDGLSCFALADASTDREFPGHLVRAGEIRIIRGYYKNSEKAYSFIVGGYENSVAAQRIPDSPDGGIIGTSFCAAWKEDGSKPDDEPATDHFASGTQRTHQGPEVGDRTVTVRRYFGVMRAIIKVHY